MNRTRLNSRERLNGMAQSIGVARLDGWGIRFDLYSERNRCAVTDIVLAPDEFVCGVLYEVPIPCVFAPKHSRSRMDRIEGVRPDGTGNYKKQRVRVIVGNDTVEALTYVGTASGRMRFASEATEHKQVSHEYFRNLELGANMFRMAEAYKIYLRQRAGMLRGNVQGTEASLMPNPAD